MSSSGESQSEPTEQVSGQLPEESVAHSEVTQTSSENLNQTNWGGTNYQTQTGAENTNFIGGVHQHQTDLSQVEQTVLRDIRAGGNITTGDIHVTTVIATPTPPLPEGIPANLPHSGVVEFVGRAAAMAQLDRLLQQGERVAVSAIAGMGGMGKTELALQYALAHALQYGAGLCWLQARGVEVGTQLVRFAQTQLGLNPPDTFELLDQVKYCWRNWRSGPALLIFDDVTDYEAIEPYLPPATEPRFKVLITTRLRLGKSVNQLALDVLEEAAALALLQSLVGGDRVAAEIDEAKLLCQQLGFLPLGLELVGRYVDGRKDLSLAEMGRRLQAKQLAAPALRQPDADMTAQLGVAAAFQLSWEALSEDAKQLGYVLSLFAAAPIDWSLVQQCCEDRDSEDLEEIRDGELLNLHLLQRVAPATYRLHPLIREFFEAKLAEYSSDPRLFQKAGDLKRQFCQVMATNAKQIPERPTHEQIVTLTPLIPHLARAATTLKDWLSDENLINPYEGLVQFYYGQGAYAEEELWCEQCLSISRSRLGEEHLAVAQSLNNLALVYRSQGRYSEAEPLFVQALALRRHLLGEEHLAVAQSLDNLALVYRSQGRYSEAESLCVQALALRQRTLGEEHPHVAQSLNNLAGLYRDQGRYSEAEPLIQRAIEIWKQALGDAHPNVGRGLDNLGMLYAAQGQNQVAESTYRSALEILEPGLGAEHPWTVRCRENLERLRAADGERM